ncbi:hypothetical protein CTRI78_v011012 [Colletotrichum trifolii]|uniref:Uncharacterized protein n=1 Tax=Colletotrichum trifolii TaxID=5466 RepID=A0A4R8QKY1_COLTR|nr:hypothetical protein CTRI78_v011012 [Colletotrichum trifolii]
MKMPMAWLTFSPRPLGDATTQGKQPSMSPPWRPSHPQCHSCHSTSISRSPGTPQRPPRRRSCAASSRPTAVFPPSPTRVCLQVHSYSQRPSATGRTRSDFSDFS